jgi:hypothetical protein
MFQNFFALFSLNYVLLLIGKEDHNTNKNIALSNKRVTRVKDHTGIIYHNNNKLKGQRL